MEKSKIERPMFGVGDVKDLKQLEQAKFKKMPTDDPNIVEFYNPKLEWERYKVNIKTKEVINPPEKHSSGQGTFNAGSPFGATNPGENKPIGYKLPNKEK